MISAKLIELMPNKNDIPSARIKDLFEFNFEDFTLENYNPYPGIKAPVAV